MIARIRGAELCALTLLKCLAVPVLLLAVMLSVAGGSAQENRKLLKKVEPVYPELARRMNMTGTVKVEVSVSADGNVGEVKTLGGNPVLAAAVEDAVKQWKYAAGAAETKKLEFKF